ncbi:MAG: hypothetical protein HY286_04630 [Planctomycetes bacterium]|nr:hypothetical protein [Planctomycetota bacterium]
MLTKLIAGFSVIASIHFFAAGALYAAPGGQFHEGYIFILSSSLPTPPVANAGLLRLDPSTGAIQQILTADWPSVNTSFVYDGYRAKLIMSAHPTGAPGFSTCIKVDADGTWTQFTNMPASIKKMSSIGDGRIFYLFNNGTAQNPLRYMDASDISHDVLNAAGTGGFSATPTGQINDMIYEPQTASIWILTFPNASPCGNTFGIYRIQLNGAGTQVVGAPLVYTYCLGGSGFYNGTRLSRGPNGNILVALQSTVPQPNANAFMIDPGSMSGSVYSMWQDSTSPGVLTAGIYSSYLNGMLFVDTFQDEMRYFSQGSGGGGFTFDKGLVSSAGGSAEAVGMAEVRLAPVGLANYGSGTPGCLGYQHLTANQSPKVNAVDFRLICTNAPPSSLGLILITDVADVAGTDYFSLNFLVHLDLINSTQLLWADIDSNPVGFGESPVPLIIDPMLVGQTFYEQAIWYWTGCAPPSGTGFSSSDALVTTIQP